MRIYRLTYLKKFNFKSKICKYNHITSTQEYTVRACATIHIMRTWQCKWKGQALTTEVAICDAEVERTERLWWHNTGAILQVCEAFFQHMVNSRSKCKVVYKDNGGTNNFLTMLICQEISLDETVVAVLLTIPAHPFAKVYIHAL